MKKMFWGILLILAGIILGLNALNVTNINLFFDGWWTLFIIVPSIYGLLKGEYKTLNIDLKTMNLNIKTGDNFKIESSKKNIVLKSDESKLSIKEDRNSTFLNIKNEIIVIYIPEHTLMDEVNINTGTGNITIDKLTSNFLELNTGTGKTKIGDLNILKKTKLDCGVGKLEILNSHINNLDMELCMEMVVIL